MGLLHEGLFVATNDRGCRIRHRVLYSPLTRSAFVTADILHSVFPVPLSSVPVGAVNELKFGLGDGNCTSIAKVCDYNRSPIPFERSVPFTCS